jgi:hypothetical protein
MVHGLIKRRRDLRNIKFVVGELGGREVDATEDR